MMATAPTILILHGTGGAPDGNWFPWLARELRLSGHSVLIPQLPTPAGQTLENWTATFQQSVGDLTANMVLVGHSMGVGFALRLLERASCSVRGCLFVSGWEGLLNSEEFDPLIKSFYRGPFDYAHIQRSMGECRLYHGDNDPYVPLSLGESLAENLNAPLTVVHDGGHLNSESGYVKFPALLQDLRSLLDTGS